MMSIINFIVKILTFFGTAFRATVEQLTCTSCRLIIEDVSYFGKGPQCGHVAHEMPRTHKEAGAICIRPLLINFLLGLILLLPTSVSLFISENYRIAVLIVYWIGISLWTNLFPSRIDAGTYRAYAAEQPGGLKKGIAALLLFGAKAESTGLTLLTSVLSSFALAQCARLILPLFNTLLSK